MRNYFDLKSWRLSAIAVLTALAVVAPASEVFAQQQVSGAYTQELEGDQVIRTNGTLAEARNGSGKLLDVWRGDDTGHSQGTPTATPVWLSFQNGPAFQIGSTSTFASPCGGALWE